jgi:hypothetical protein
MQRSNGQDSTNAATILTIASGGSSNVEKLATAAVTAGEYEGHVVSRGIHDPVGEFVRGCDDLAADAGPRLHQVY